MNTSTLQLISKLIMQKPKPNATLAELAALRRRQEKLLELSGGRVRVPATTKQVK